MTTEPQTLDQLPTPSLVVDRAVFDANVAAMSDEHTTLWDPDARLAVGDRVRLLPGHLDPTVARHEQYWVVDGDDVVDRWPVDLRHW